MSRHLLTAQEVADMLHVQKSWVYLATRSNEIPHVRLGRYVRFDEQTVEKWISDKEAANGTPGSVPHTERR